MSDVQIKNERGAFGGTVAGPEGGDEITVTAVGAIAAGTVVEFLSTNYNATTKNYEVSAAAVDGFNHAILGVALEAAAAAGDRIRVCQRGVCSVLTAAAVAVDKQLVVVTTAGKVDDVASVPDDGTAADRLVKVIGQSLTSSDGAGTITAYINC